MSGADLTLLCSLAHPDDESLGFGGTLARYAAAGVQTHLISATRGEYGWTGAPDDFPGPQALGRIREAELLAAADVLGLRSVQFLDHIDGVLDQADPARVIASIAGHIRRLRPHVVLTFDPFGIYGHPDHIAIAQFTTAAVVAAADSDFVSDAPPHRVHKLYYRAWNTTESQAFETAFGEMVMRIDGVDRHTTVWPEWSITTRLDTTAYTNQVWRAVECHRSQLPGLERLLALPQDARRDIFSAQTFYRALSFVNGRREVEQDLFAGISLPVSLP